jgi:hypothetical protein
LHANPIVKTHTLVLIAFIGKILYGAEADPREIVTRSIANYEKDSAAALDFTYTEHDVTKDSTGHPKSTEILQVTVLDGTPYSRLIGRDGHPLSPEEAARENEKYEKAVASREKETAEQRARRLRKYGSEWGFLHEVPSAFDIRMIGHETLLGRPNYVIELIPRSGYVPKARNARMFPDIRGKLWIDEQDVRWTMAEAHIINTISIGWFLARIGPGAHITLKQVKVEGEHWMPKEINIDGSARIMLVKSRPLDQSLVYSDYKRVRPAQGTAAAKNR